MQPKNSEDMNAQVQKIKDEIEHRWRELADKNAKCGGGKYDMEISQLLSLKSFIEKLPEEPVCEEEQMMKDSFNAVVIPADYESEHFSLEDDYDEWPEKFGVVQCVTKMVKEDKLKPGDKVKVIIVKQ